MTDETKAFIQAHWRDAKKQNDAEVKLLHELTAEPEGNIRQLLGLPEKPGPKNKRPYTKPADPQTKKDLCKLVMLDGLTVMEASERMGVKLATARTWVLAAKRQQKAFLDYPEQPAVAAEPAAAPAPEQIPEPITATAEEPETSLQDGLNGLWAFMDAFDGTGLLDDLEPHPHKLYRDATLFVAGVEYAQKERRQGCHPDDARK